MMSGLLIPVQRRPGCAFRRLVLLGAVVPLVHVPDADVPVVGGFANAGRSALLETRVVPCTTSK